MFYAIFFLTLLIAVYLFGRMLKRNILPEMIIALLIGLSWEIYSVYEWSYDSSRLTMVNVGTEKIPIDIVLTWGAALPASVIFVEEICKKLKNKSKAVFFFSGVIVLLLVGLLIEFVGYNSGLWIYNIDFNLTFWPTNVPLRIVFGWVFLGSTYLATVKFYRDEVERKINTIFKKFK